MPASKQLGEWELPLEEGEGYLIFTGTHPQSIKPIFKLELVRWDKNYLLQGLESENLDQKHNILLHTLSKIKRPNNSDLLRVEVELPSRSNLSLNDFELKAEFFLPQNSRQHSKSNRQKPSENIGHGYGTSPFEWL